MSHIFTLRNILDSIGLLVFFAGLIGILFIGDAAGMK